VWERRSIDAVDRKTSPRVTTRAGVCPHLGAALEQPPNRLIPEPIPRLRDRAGRGSRTTPAGQRQVKLCNDLGDGLVAVDAHPKHEPYDLLGRQPPPPNRRGARRLESFVDPVRVETRAKSLEQLTRNVIGANDLIDGATRHGPPSREIAAS
jgi:hypothetical protein